MSLQKIDNNWLYYIIIDITNILFTYSVMWIKLLIQSALFFMVTNKAFCHVPNHISTPSSKVDQFCLMADTCVHDTIAICGRMGDETRTFLDLCDLLEYACDTNLIFTHIEDTKDCPAERKKV
ncbi:hypothetical protein ACJJTC_017263 [Scirpophaga incertulas]